MTANGRLQWRSGTKRLVPPVSSPGKQKAAKDTPGMHKHRSSTLLILSLALLAGASMGRAQLVQVPSIGPTVGGLGNIGSSVLDNVERPLGHLSLDAGSLASARLGRLRDLVHAHRDLLEPTQAGPAVRGEVVAIDPGPSAVQSAVAVGFIMLGEERIEGLDMHIV